MLSSWVIGGLPAGLCFREDTSIITNNNSGFVPHYINYGNETKRSFNFRANEHQKKLRHDIYAETHDTEVYKNALFRKNPVVTFNATPDKGKHVRRCHCGGGCPSYRRSSRSYARSGGSSGGFLGGLTGRSARRERLK